MGTAYVARSKILQTWGGDVGLGKNLYKLGYVLEGTPAEALADGLAGAADWVVVTARPADAPSQDAILDRLARKEKLVDPAYYPRLKGETGIVKVNPGSVENSMRIRFALETGREVNEIKVKPTDIARYLLDNALG
jgi:hypothetical protein